MTNANNFSIDSRERDFLSQKDVFVERSLKQMGFSSLIEVEDILSRDPIPIAPILIQDFSLLSAEEKNDIASAYWGRHGVAHFVVLNAEVAYERHPSLTIALQLRGALPLSHPIDHPMETHKEAISRFGRPDGTLKIYDLPVPVGGPRYREQAETSEMFDAHNDGLGYGGLVEAFTLYANSPPLWGGYTYFQNLIHLGLLLARNDPEAFQALFLPDAITALRPRGKGAISVSTPVFFLNEDGQPQVFFRLPTGEYQIYWREDVPALNRARELLNRHSRPFSGGSIFVNLSRKGAGCVVRNGWLVHGRTPFIDGENPETRRVLARKWFMTAERHTHYKHVPGMHLMPEYAAMYPERFGPDRLEGDWNWNAEKAINERIS